MAGRKMKFPCLVSKGRTGSKVIRNVARCASGAEPPFCATSKKKFRDSTGALGFASFEASSVLELDSGLEAVEGVSSAKLALLKIVNTTKTPAAGAQRVFRWIMLSILGLSVSASRQNLAIRKRQRQ